MKNKHLKLTTMVGVLVFLTACAPQGERFSYENLAGFWWGLWHGMVVIFFFIGSWFSENVGIYATFNNGFWYNLGYLLGIGAIGKAVSFTRGRD